ncbi:MAG: hypothetical protein DRN96_05575 [Thermoproteota archaeon]|nr:MAG: hypothetical protein DRN96_05575 [Candidatus Korarchaeota archaeon]RLG55412.1 MAG: hypothetical protein DRN99_02710 [Candidatus Korarchaeota archaeon]
MPFDPIHLAEKVSRVCSRSTCGSSERMVFDHRDFGSPAPGAYINLAGCCLRCIFCWVPHHALEPHEGVYLTPSEAASLLLHRARRKRSFLLKITGGEPVLPGTCFQHLKAMLEHVEDALKGATVVLETNGMLLGYDFDMCLDLAAFSSLVVRVSFKGCDEEEFSRLTGAKPEFYRLQMEAIANLSDAGVSLRASLVSSFSTPSSIELFRVKLSEVYPEVAKELELEELYLTGELKKRLEERGLKYRSYRASKPSPEWI